MNISKVPSNSKKIRFSFSKIEKILLKMFLKSKKIYCIKGMVQNPRKLE